MPAANAVLQRQAFAVARASEYFVASELQAQTGQPVDRFAAVAVKELLDNALDAAETAGVPPEVTLLVAHRPGEVDLTVSDNGPGLPAATVASILDFTTRTSDKAAYRSPTRGAQGNALKTILGLPHALGGRAPVEIEACGVRHTIGAWVDPSGDVRVEHTQDARPTRPGTCVALTLPDRGQVLAPAWWARAFALWNPHASVKLSLSGDASEHAHEAGSPVDDFYEPVAAWPTAWRKWLPTDPTSPWWYDEGTLRRLIFLHIAAARRGAGPDLTLRDFVRQFKGLTGTAKAKAVGAACPTIGHLRDFEGQEAQVPALLAAMQGEATPPPPAVLGRIGEATLRARFDAWYGIVPGRWWYARVEGVTPGGIPFVVEAAVAETERPGQLFTGVNFSPTFDDPFSRTALAVEQVTAHGARSFLTRCDADPYHHEGAPVAAAVHLICPALEFLDRGKTQLQLRPAIAEAVADVLWRVGKVRYREARDRERDARKAARVANERRRAATRPSCSLIEACFAEMLTALAHASGDGQYTVSVKDLHYAIRPLVQQHTDRTLEYSYFSQTVVTAYRQQVGELRGLCYDPRGVLIEPHTRKEVPLGTRDVEEYAFPAWRFDKILYVEKKGRAAMLCEAGLLERFDLAVIAAEGYATEAARVLFAHAQQGRQYQLFVLHDADPYGYNIARTLREATARMPGHQVDVIDLGLRFEDALGMALLTEAFTRKTALPKEVAAQLTPRERAAFEGRLAGRTAKGTPQYTCERIELNAMTAPAFVAYVEEQLVAHGADTKVTPPSNLLDAVAADHYARAVDTEVEAVLEVLLDVPAVKLQVRDALREAVLWRRVDLAALVPRFLQGHRALPWGDVVRARVDTRLGRQEAALRDQVREALQARVEALATRGAEALQDFADGGAS
jgi:hypothetical protein